MTGVGLRDALAIAAEAIAAECGCDAGDLAAPGVRVVPRPPPRSDPRMRHYPPWDPAFAVVSFGAGALVSASPPILRAAETIFADADREGVFQPERLGRAAALLEGYGLGVFGPSPRLVCGVDRWRARPAPAGTSIELERDPSPERIDALEVGRFPNAFSPSRRVERPTRVLALAHAGDELVGAASATQDSDALWQVGIDVTEPLRRRGVAAALTSAVARATLDAGRVPFYGLAAANLASLRTALAAGFTPAWLEVFTGMRSDASRRPG